MVQKCPPNGPKSRKIKFWRCLGALWGPPWRQDGAKATPRRRKPKKYMILGSLGGSKMELKSIENHIEKSKIFGSDFGSDFNRSWYDFGTKNLSKIGLLSLIFSTLLLICEKCDFE